MNEPLRKQRGIVRSHKVLQSALIPFIRRKRRSIRASARINRYTTSFAIQQKSRRIFIRRDFCCKNARFFPMINLFEPKASKKNQRKLLERS